MRPSWLCVILLTLADLQQCVRSSRDLFVRTERVRSSEIEAGRSASLARLLREVVSQNFGECVLSLIYDSNYEQHHPVDFRAYFEDLPLAFRQESVDMSKGETLRERRSDKCTNYLLFLDNIAAVKHILARDVSSKIVVVSAETPWEVKDFLKSDVARHYANLVVICHSTSRKTGNGAFLLYTNKLYADGSGASQPLLLTSWLNNSWSRVAELFYDKFKGGFMGHRLLVSTVENPPFTIKRSKSSLEETQWDGLEVRLLQLTGAYLNFSVEFTEPRSPLAAYSLVVHRVVAAYMSNSMKIHTLEAAKADVAQGLSSMALGGIYRTIDLGDAFEATTPHYQDCATFISLASSALPKYRAILGPFQLTVWIMLCVSYFVLIVPLTFNSNYSVLSLLKEPSGFNTMFWFVFSTYTNSFVVKSPLLDYGIAKNATTLLLGIYWVFTIIVTACYTGSIVAFITLPVFPAAMEKAEDLAYYRYRIGTLDHSGWEKWFNVSETDDPFLKKLFRKMEYVPSLREGVQNASRAYFWPYAFLASKTALEYMVQTDFAPAQAAKRSLMHVSNECFTRYQVVQLLPSKSLYTKRMSEFVVRANEHGLLDRITSDIDWEVQRLATVTGKKITKGLSQAIVMEDRVLAVEDTQGMFLVLGSGLLMALLSLSLENFSGCLKRRKQANKRKDLPRSHTNRLDQHSHSELRLRHCRGSV